MSIPLLVSLDFTSIPSSGLSLQSISHISNVLLEVSDDNYDAALSFIPENFSRFEFTVDVRKLGSLEPIRKLLDVGASKVAVSVEQMEQLDALAAKSQAGQQAMDLERLILAVVPPDTAEEREANRERFLNVLGDKPVGLFAVEIKDPEFATGLLSEYGVEDRPPVYVSFAEPPTLEEVLHLTALKATPVLPSQLLTVDPKRELQLLPASDIIFSWISTDRHDGLITTLVVDEGGVALGLVYSSKESVAESLRTGSGVYMSRKRGLWYKGATSGATQELVKVDMDCDADCLRFVVIQKGKGFCHLETRTCFGKAKGLPALQSTLQSRLQSAPPGSYTARLYSDASLLRSKIMEEAEELCHAQSKEDIAFEAADLFYFALTKCVSAGVTLADIEKNLDAKSLKVERRKGDAKDKWAEPKKATEQSTKIRTTGRIQMKSYDAKALSKPELDALLQRPSQRSSESVMAIVNPIIADVRKDGDAALLKYAQKFDRADLKSPVLLAPFPESLMNLTPRVQAAIDLSFDNIWKFHEAQDTKPLHVETMPGVRCSRFARPIGRVGLYIPGGSAVLPSTALMLGVPAKVAGCGTIILASPPRPDGTVTPEIVYIAHKIGAQAIVLAGGAQAVAALAYGTESVPKVDKILGPGNQFVTAAKMLVSNDTSAGVSIDMPAGPSEVLVVADKSAVPAFVASDLLSQAEHGVDSQVMLISVGLSDSELQAIEEEVHKQAMELPRVDIVRGSIQHSVTLNVPDMDTALELSNAYAPEHLILQVEDAAKWVDKVQNAGSVFIGPWTPESVGDYSAGVNHSLPTYGYARQYSGVNLATFVKHITSSELTPTGLRNLGNAVMDLAATEGLDAHRLAVKMRFDYMEEKGLA